VSTVRGEVYFHDERIGYLPVAGEALLQGTVENLKMKSIYVGNLPFTATEDEVRQLFEPHGEVSSVKLINDRETDRPRGFGFVEMNDADAEAAISALDGKDFNGRGLRVNEAQPRQPRGPRPGGGRPPRRPM
jgi:RNA recognition motif-containing protein